MAALKDPRSRYYIGEMISNLAQQYGANERDMRLIGYIKGRLVTILESEYKLKENQKNGNNNEEEWYELLASMENAISQLAELVGKLPFLENVDDSIRRTIDGRVNKFYTIHEKFQDFYDENIDTSNVEVEPEMDDEEMPETPEADIDNVGFEDDVQMTDDEQDDAAWEGAEDFNEDDFDYMSLDLSSVTPRRINEAGTRLNVFGKHPGYRKKIMSLPRTGADREGIYRDWNDDSVYSEQPYGEHIGSSAPFDNAVKASVDSIVESLKKKL
jgi:hypothetical protein